MAVFIAPQSVPDLVVCSILRFVAWGLYHSDHPALARFILTCRTARRHAQGLLDEFVYITTPISVTRFAERVRQDNAAFRSVRLLSILADVDTSDPDVIDDLDDILHRCNVMVLEVSTVIFQDCVSSARASTIFVTRTSRPHLCDFQAITHSHGYQDHIRRLVIHYDQSTRFTEALVHLRCLTHIAVVITQYVQRWTLEELFENMARHRRLHVVVVGTATSLRDIDDLSSRRATLSFNAFIFEPLAEDIQTSAPALRDSLYVRNALGEIDIWQRLAGIEMRTGPPL